MFGQFKTDRYIMFNVESGIDLNILGLIPSAVLGVIGGLLGSAFTAINLRLTVARHAFHRRVAAASASSAAANRNVNLVKLLEPVLILTVSRKRTWHSLHKHR